MLFTFTPPSCRLFVGQGPQVSSKPALVLFQPQTSSSALKFPYPFIYFFPLFWTSSSSFPSLSLSSNRFFLFASLPLANGQFLPEAYVFSSKPSRVVGSFPKLHSKLIKTPLRYRDIGIKDRLYKYKTLALLHSSILYRHRWPSLYRNV